MAKSIFIALPNDLLDQIFADVDREDLINLIKTHQSFMKSAQRHLFHTINLPAQSTLGKSFVTYDNKIIDASQVQEYIRWEQDHNRYLDAGPSILLPIPDAQKSLSKTGWQVENGSQSSKFVYSSYSTCLKTSESRQSF